MKFKSEIGKELVTMRRSRSRTIIGTLLTLGLAGSLLAISGDQVLQRMEEAMRPGEDMMATERMTVIPSDGSEEVMEIGAYQKGEKMLICIVSPEEFAGIGVLVLPQEEGPGEEIYLYLPAFRAVKKIEAEARSEGFVGSDFAYEDLTMKYADKYEVKELQEEAEAYILKLAPKPDAAISYGEARMRVDRESFIPSKAEFDKAGELFKVMQLSEVIEVPSSKDEEKSYLTPTRIEMETVKKGSKTVVELLEVEYDTGLEDDFFTPVNLKRQCG